ncbi:hypothetical protein [Thioclava dalianensis]|nr:hypothetical protein [Thioclava dalianensis]
MDLLRVERDAIRAGEFNALTELAAQKESLIEQVAALEPLDPQALEALRAIAAENQRLLEAALKGVRSAQRRLRAVINAANGFNAYDRSGQVKPIRKDDGSLEFRA